MEIEGRREDKSMDGNNLEHLEYETMRTVDQVWVEDIGLDGIDVESNLMGSSKNGKVEGLKQMNRKIMSSKDEDDS